MQKEKRNTRDNKQKQTMSSASHFVGHARGSTQRDSSGRSFMIGASHPMGSGVRRIPIFLNAQHNTYLRRKPSTSGRGVVRTRQRR